jgi:phosphatidylcholine synthase
MGYEGASHLTRPERPIYSGGEKPGALLLPPFIKACAFGVHIFTSAGAAFALAALLYATAAQWTAMFLCLGVALVIDGIDGVIARHLKVATVLPRWSGDVLDLIVDFVTYVFVPAYAIAAGGLLPARFGLPAGVLIVITSAIYFADREMKLAGNYFRGFPALWNATAFYLFVLKPAPWLAVLIIVVLAVLTFTSFRFLHPMRVRRFRALNIIVMLAWSLLAIIALLRDLEPGPWVLGGLLIIGMYFFAVGLTDRPDEAR